MADRILRTIHLFRRALRDRRGGAFQDTHASFAKILHRRMRPQWWPSNTPRPRRYETTEPLNPLLEQTEHASLCSADEVSSDCDSLHAAVYVRAIEAKKESGGVTSWSKTPISKLREPTPTTPKLTSIDAVLTENPPHPEVYSPGAEISKAIEHDWQTSYRFVRQITPGNQGQVDIYTHRPTGKLTIVKTIKTNKGIPLEATILKDHIAPHTNLVELHALFYDPKLQTCKIVMEYCSGGDLHDFTDHWLYTRNKQIPEIFLLHFVASMGEALGFLHLGRRLVPNENGFGMPSIAEDPDHMPILHRDIKLENIFLRWSPYNQYELPDIVLGDFGGARLESQNLGGFGTPGYFPPEVLRYMYYGETTQNGPAQHSAGTVMTKASDVYTFGVTLCYMMLWGNYNQGMNMKPAFKRSNLRNWPLLLALLEACIDYHPHDRPSTECLLNWAAVLKMHVRSLYDNGVRMPDNSWPQIRYQLDESSDTVTDSYSVYSQSSIGTIASLSRFPTPPPPKPAGTVDQCPPEYIEAVHDPINEQTRTGAFQRSSTARRLSVLYEIIERMANSLVGNIQAAKSRASIVYPKRSTRASILSAAATPRELLEHAVLVSKFSDDSDVD